MNTPNETYTYRNGQKLALRKNPNEFVIRAKPERLEQYGIMAAEPVSPASSRVTTGDAELETAMEQARKIAVTHHAYYEAATDREFLITDRIFVTFHQVPSPEQLDEFAGRYGLLRKETYGDRDFLFQLTEHTGMNPVKLVVKLTEEEDAVESAEHDLNFRVQTRQFQPPTDPNYPRQWHLHTKLQDVAFDPRSSSRCEDAWRALNGYGSFDVVVGLTDDGCKLDHRDFDSAGKFAGWGYFRGSRLVKQGEIDAKPSEMYIQESNHGTSCAGVIAGEADAVLTVGAAPGCRLLPIQWESDGPSLYISDSKLMTALDYVADKVDVLSNSWGMSPASDHAEPVLRRIRELAVSGGRRGRGIVFLWAAGNENCPIQHNATVDIPYDNGWAPKADGTWRWVGVSKARVFSHNLTSIPGVMHIAALASNAQRSHYSNYGTGVTLCASSSNGHAYSRMRVTGLGITTTTGESGGVTREFGGTSSATPLVAGIAALTISANPGLKASEVISILKRTASKNLNLAGYTKTPPANYDPNTQWDISPVAPFDRGDFLDIRDPDGSWSPWFGHGKVDAAAAVTEALRLTGTTGGGRAIRQASAPVLPIPDNSPAGARDVLRFSDSVIVGSLKVEVDITHSYIGDLRLTLTAPSGRTAVLHDRNGGRTANLKQSFDSASSPALAVLIGQPVHGDWSLWVQDLAPSDRGVLNRWEIAIEGRQDNTVLLEEAAGATIPDNAPNGIERLLSAAGNGQVRDISVSVDITHTYIGDLDVSLIAPNGVRVTLHERAGGQDDNLIKIFTSATTPGLATLRGLPVQGAWRLRVADLEARDIGKLNRWGLRIERDV